MHFEHCLSVSDIHGLCEQMCHKTTVFHETWHHASLLLPWDGKRSNERKLSLEMVNVGHGQCLTPSSSASGVAGGSFRVCL